MKNSIPPIRRQFSIFLLILMWLHVPLTTGLVWMQKLAPERMRFALTATTLIAIVYTLSWLSDQSGRATRLLSSVALVCEAAVLVAVFNGHPWQMDLHLYFFALLALTIAWFDRQALLLAAGTITFHHLTLLFLLPNLVFPAEGNFERVLLHATIIAFQTAVLVWLTELVLASFNRVEQMQAQIYEKTSAFNTLLFTSNQLLAQSGGNSEGATGPVSVDMDTVFAKQSQWFNQDLDAPSPSKQAPAAKHEHTSSGKSETI